MASPDDATAIEMLKAEGEELGRLVRLLDGNDREAGLTQLVAAIERLNREALESLLFTAIATLGEVRAGRVSLKPPG